jgi:ABC-2 type transport system permease protein
MGAAILGYNPSKGMMVKKGGGGDWLRVSNRYY